MKHEWNVKGCDIVAPCITFAPHEKLPWIFKIILFKNKYLYNIPLCTLRAAGPPARRTGC